MTPRNPSHPNLEQLADKLQNEISGDYSPASEFRTILAHITAAYRAGAADAHEADVQIVGAFRHFVDGPEGQIKFYIMEAIRALAEKERGKQ